MNDGRAGRQRTPSLCTDSAAAARALEEQLLLDFQAEMDSGPTIDKESVLPCGLASGASKRARDSKPDAIEGPLLLLKRAPGSDGQAEAAAAALVGP